jgi:hypothetical protein
LAEHPVDGPESRSEKGGRLRPKGETYDTDEQSQSDREDCPYAERLRGIEDVVGETLRGPAGGEGNRHRDRDGIDRRKQDKASK